MTLPFAVVVVGNVGIDTNIYGLKAGINLDVETTFTENIDYIGQAGGYTSRGFAQLGNATAFIGAVGDDASGAWIRETFKHDGIDMTALFVDPSGTSRSINLMYADGKRKSFYDGKSHMQLQPNLTLCRAVLARTGLAHFHLPDWARLLLPIARELGVTISCDLQDIVSLPDSYRQDFIDAADILFCSASHYENPTPLIQQLLGSYPTRVVVVGMGSKGCAVGTQQGVQFFAAIPDDRPVIDTNGAGDALAVGFLTSFVLEGYALPDAILRGQIAARHTCSLKADSSHLITREKLEARFVYLTSG